jgi:hypothetical protein
MRAPWFRVTCSAFLLSTVATCTSDSFFTAPQPTIDDLRASVTGDAASAVSDAGKFVLPAPPITLATQLTSVEATKLAVVWSQQFGPLLRSDLEGAHGGPIAFGNLEPCGRPLYGESAFEEPPLDMLPSSRRAVGPWWFITLCQGDTPTVSVAVSAWATELRIVDNRIVFPTNQGMEFSGHGIPLGHTGEYPVSPELAAVSAARQTGRRVASSPYLLAPFNKRGHPGYARWHWRLEDTVVVKTETGRSLSAGEVFVGEAVPVSRGEILYAPAANQPDTVMVESPPPGILGESRTSYEERLRTQTRIIPVARRPGVPVLFDRITSVESVP